MKSIKLTIEYQNGNKLEQIVNYVHCENGEICFSVKKQVYFGFGEMVRVPLANIKAFDITETDQRFDH